MVRAGYGAIPDSGRRRSGLSCACRPCLGHGNGRTYRVPFENTSEEWIQGAVRGEMKAPPQDLCKAYFGSLQLTLRRPLSALETAVFLYMRTASADRSAAGASVAGVIAGVVVWHIDVVVFGQKNNWWDGGK
ncbi:uncharacterized protein SPSK_00186 [Sporothrix schenckii 1099-18]|uniref:Uncharacterized protein n=1 Tax=Sporothrix schenckii 1099-18 TaxID=1397361 RepID=A0A0F2M6A7_SPOSC|nr:uncharacterized protein SPSK_00186 [Sporothrix schenckii 1099-18]KJR83716.1 hypothetical protein SPSK_00186 [Sporothrix schenckii 1099-18]